MAKSILVIDDSIEMLDVQKILLGEEGFEVFTAQSGTEAFAVLARITKPDLILLDMQMDDMSGADFLVLLEEKNPDIVETVPIVFLTAMDEVPKSKAKGFIKKPLKVDKFLADVHRFIEMRV